MINTIAVILIIISAVLFKIAIPTSYQEIEYCLAKKNDKKRIILFILGMTLLFVAAILSGYTNAIINV